MTTSGKSRDYCFTINNYTDDQLEFLRTYKCQYIVIGKEIAPTTKTPHIQGYVYFKNPRSFEAVRKELWNNHIEATKGTPQEASEYCKEDGDYEEYGVCPHQGKRTDIDAVRDTLKSGAGMRGVVAKATNLQQIKIAEQILKYEEPKRSWVPIVYWYYGNTGTGKSKRAHEIFENKDYFRKTGNSGKWWEGYDAHENVIIDDVKWNTFEYKNWLDLLDRYETRVECKGGSRQFLARNIIITSSISPKEMFQDQDQNGAEILRRITDIVYFP